MRSDRVLSFSEFISLDETSNTITDTINTSTNIDLSTTNNITNNNNIKLANLRVHERVNIMDPEYQQSIYDRYITEVNSDKYKRQMNLEGVIFRDTFKVARLIDHPNCDVGRLVIGKCKIL